MDTCGRKHGILRMLILFLLLFVWVSCSSVSAVDETTPSQTPNNGNPYYIMVNRQMNTVTVYTLDESGYYSVPCKAMVCSTGRTGHTTPTGTFRLQAPKRRWCYMVDGSYGQYSSTITGNYLFHSVCYTAPDSSKLIDYEYNMLGGFASLGCVRLQVRDAKWIYDNCGIGTLVSIYDSADPGPLGKPKREVSEVLAQNGICWEPTDPEYGNPWRLTVTITKSGDGQGTAEGGGTVIKGGSVTVKADPDDNSVFSGWYGSDWTLRSTELVYTYVPDQSEVLYAHFDAKVQLSGVASRSGRVEGGGSVQKWKEASLTAVPDEGKEFFGWYDRDEHFLGNNTVLTVLPYENTVYTAMFSGDRYIDIERGAWYETDVMEATKLGLSNGVSALKFDPQGRYTRAMIVTMIARLDGTDFSDIQNEELEDVPDGAWYYDAVNWAVAENVVELSSREFRPDEEVTRAEIITMMVRYLIYVRGETIDETDLPYSDADEIPAYDLEYMRRAQTIGLISGYEDHTMRAGSRLTRAEGTTLLMRLERYISGGEPQGEQTEDGNPDDKDTAENIRDKDDGSEYVLPDPDDGSPELPSDEEAEHTSDITADAETTVPAEDAEDPE